MIGLLMGFFVFTVDYSSLIWYNSPWTYLITDSDLGGFIFSI